MLNSPDFLVKSQAKKRECLFDSKGYISTGESETHLLHSFLVPFEANVFLKKKRSPRILFGNAFHDAPRRIGELDCRVKRNPPLIWHYV
jgi:hypothetical protein